MRKYLLFLFILITVLATVFLKRNNHTIGDVDYTASIKEYSQHGILPENKLNIDVEINSITFRIIFQGGSGENEKVSLTQNGNKYSINLLNTDKKSEEMIAVYDLTGQIMNISSGNYSIVVIDSTGRIIDTQTFNIN